MKIAWRAKGPKGKNVKGWPGKQEMKEINKDFLFCTISPHASKQDKPWCVRFRETQVLGERGIDKMFRSMESAQDAARFIDRIIEYITKDQPDLKGRLLEDAQVALKKEEQKWEDEFWWGPPVEAKKHHCLYCKQAMGHFYPSTKKGYENFEFMAGGRMHDDCVKQSQKIAIELQRMLNGEISIEEWNEIEKTIPDGYGDPIAIWSFFYEPIRNDMRDTLPIKI